VQKIANTQQDHPNLPLTGANGELLMTIGGAALLLLGGGAYLVTRRRSSDRA
jgi:LPXTG-motif cell wall-anchored protein